MSVRGRPGRGFRADDVGDVHDILHGDAGVDTSLATGAFLTTASRATRPDRGRRTFATRRKSLQQVVRGDVEPGRWTKNGCSRPHWNGRPRPNGRPSWPRPAPGTAPRGRAWDGAG